MKIPFNKKTGNMLDYTWVATGEEVGDVTWKENYEFEATMEFTHFSRGRSSVKAHFNGPKGRDYEMFLSDFEKLLKDGLFEKYITGTFTFVKRGANYGIKMI